MQNSTPQERIKATLAKSGIAYKHIDCYGSQIVITSWSKDAAQKWTSLLSKFAIVRGNTESLDEAVENKGTSLRPTMIPVFRTFARIASNDEGPTAPAAQVAA